MMDFSKDGASRWLTQLAEQGKSMEENLVWKWYRAGRLLTPPPSEYQLQFIDKDNWLTSTTDAIILPPRANQGVVAEVKSSFNEAINDMKKLLRGPNPRHVNQVKCQIGMAHEYGEWEVMRCYNSGRIGLPADHGLWVCPQHLTEECLEKVILEPVNYGFLYYVSRDEPTNTFEFYFEYDPSFMKAGRKRLQGWRQNFLDDILPAENFEDKRYSHPFGWLWGEEPCKYCDWGPICRADRVLEKERGNNIKLSESVGVDKTREIRPEYDVERARVDVVDRWP